MKTRSHKDVHMDAHRRLIPNRQHQKQPRRLSTDTLIVVHPYDGIVLSKKHEQTADRNNDLDEFQKHAAEQKTQKMYRKYFSIYMPFQKMLDLSMETNTQTEVTSRGRLGGKWKGTSWTEGFVP